MVNASVVKAPKRNTKPRAKLNRKQQRRSRAYQVQDDPDTTRALQATVRTHPGMLRRDNSGRLAASMGLPGHAPAYRMPTVDCPRTSLCTTKDQFNINAVGFPTGWASGDTLVAFHGQPGRMMTIYTTITTGSYQFDVANSIEGESSFLPIDSGLSLVAGYTHTLSRYWNIIGGRVKTGTPPHGTSLATGHSNGVNYVWMNGQAGVNDTLVFTGTYTGAGNGIMTGTILRWAGPETDPVKESSFTLTLAAGNFTGTVFSASSPGYFAVEFDEIQCILGPMTNITLSSGGAVLNCIATTGWMQKSLTDIDPRAGGDSLLAQDCRLNAASLLITNTTAAVNRQGTVVAARQKNIEFYNMTPTLLARTAEKYVGDAACGCYTFKEFSEEMSTFRACSISTYPTFDLDFGDFYHFIHVSCPGALVNSYVCSISSTVEFKCDSSRYSKSVAEFSYDDLIAARRMINSNPEWFFENPTHAAEIYGWIKRALAGAGKFAISHAKPLALLASSVNPANAAIYSGLAGLSSLL